MRSSRAALALAALALAAAPAVGQERPSEDEIFGAPGTGPPAPPPPPAPASPAAPAVPAGREGRGEEGSRETREPLTVGGLLYLRAVTTALDGQRPAEWSLSSPNNLDLYVDARPNDRVRGFALGRMLYDPTLSPQASGLAAQLGTPVPSNPRVLLDQLWINFDLGRRAFVTAGKQHVKWGVGRFWNPTDYLHRTRRDPLAVFDPRLGVTMVKAHVPWEARGWNLYGMVVLEDLAPERPATSTPSFEAASGPQLSDLGVGGRAEVVLGTFEIGADAIAGQQHRPKFGIDVSAGVWELDLYAEVALRTASDLPRWREVDPSARLDLRFVEDHATGFTPAAVLGGTWSTKYSDEDVVTVGAEYFFDDSGYDDPAVYPFLLFGAPQFVGTTAAALPFEQRDPGAFTPFYLGRHYAGAFVTLPSPGRWNDTSLTLSVLGNLTDKSAVARLDASVLALTYLRVELFVAGHFGGPGEFRLGFTVPPQTFGSLATPAVSVDPPVLDFGVALRLSL